MERSASIRVEEASLQRQALDFLQNLTVEVSNSTNSVRGLLSAMERQGSTGERLAARLHSQTLLQKSAAHPKCSPSTRLAIDRRLKAAMMSVALHSGDI
jgi:hypothetical protein